MKEEIKKEILELAKDELNTATVIFYQLKQVVSISEIEKVLSEKNGVKDEIKKEAIEEVIEEVIEEKKAVKKNGKTD